jgi:CDGSH-type Zn-finger protein
MAAVRITPTENGPYVVEGPVTLVDPEGNPLKAPAGTIFLCRCGASQNKPFCDSWSAGTPPTCSRRESQRPARSTRETRAGS